MAHRALRHLVLELLEEDHVRWQLHEVADRCDLAAVVISAEPDLVVLADRDLSWCLEVLPNFAPHRVVIIGPEPDPAYEHAARRAGVGAWLPSDRVAEDLIVSMHRVLGCTHDPCAVAPPDLLSL
jgi:hypothetical protein